MDDAPQDYLVQSDGEASPVSSQKKNENEKFAIIKSQRDQREYSFVQLDNQMKVLLVSDKDAEKSAACMFVGVGSLADPTDPLSPDGKKLDGMAHFCEHMLFLGTKKYPQENHYQNFVQ